jgi:hypothetical protein
LARWQGAGREGLVNVVMKELLDLIGLGTPLVPALIIGAAVYSLFQWAQVRLPPVNEYARAWLLGEVRPVTIGAAMLRLNRLLIGEDWFDRKRVWLVLGPTAAAVVWLLLSTFADSKGKLLPFGLAMIQGMLSTQPMAMALLFVFALANGLICFAVYDLVARRLPEPVTNFGAIRTYAATLLVSVVLALLAFTAIGSAVNADLTLRVLPMIVTFDIPICRDDKTAWACSIGGEITREALTGFYCLYALAALPFACLVLLFVTFVISMLLFPYVEAGTRRYFAVTDQRLALDKPMEFLAPIGAAVAFLITAVCLLLVKAAQ